MDRVASADHPAALWFDRAAFENPGAGRYGTATRTIGDAQLQFRKNADVSFAKDIRFPGGRALQLRAEIFNVTNTPKFGGAANSSDLASFGRVVLQRGFSRTWQLWLRYQF